MKKHKVFIDGSAGTTGLRIYERLAQREDIELLQIEDNQRKDITKRAEKINSAEIAFLCLPDDAATQIMPYIRPEIKVLDTSTAHRTNPDWVYGMPELYGGAVREKLKTANRVAVPGCHASGFIAACAPLLELGIAPKDYPFTCHSITGYSGGGKSMINDYENNHSVIHKSPRQYGLTQHHKHQPEMQKMCGIEHPPLFNPIVADFYSGMVVTLPLFTRMLKNKHETVESIASALDKYYKNGGVINVLPSDTMPKDGFLSANMLSGKDNMEISVFGGGEQIIITSRFDNLGKGSSGGAIQCMNIMLGCDEFKGLSL